MRKSIAQQSAFCVVVGQLTGTSKRFGCLSSATRSFQQVSTRAVPEIVGIEGELFDQRQCLVGTTGLRHRDRSVQGHDRRGADRVEMVVDGDDLWPVGL